MWLVRALIVVSMFIILLGFFVYNAEQRVSVDIISAKYYNVPLIVVVFWSFIFGLVASLVISITVYFKQTGDIRHLKKTVNSLNSEIVALRNRPIEDTDDKFLLSDKEEKQ
ncbi:MAG: LapA family protein [candidate division Zixibacteria bacterium]|nr:LapA family protein [candidate division Zixibacteria bacterium]